MDIVNKYYKRTDLNKDGVFIYYCIEKFDHDKDCYIATEYSQSFGKSIKVKNIELMKDFYLCENYKVISKEEFDIIMHFHETSGKYEFD